MAYCQLPLMYFPQKAIIAQRLVHRVVKFWNPET